MEKKTDNIKETELHDVQWPPALTGENDTVDVLMMGYTPEGDRPDGITQGEQLIPTEPYPTGQPYTYPEALETNVSACGNCRFYVDGGACALVKDAIDPINGICKFYEAGTPLSYSTQVFPLYEKVEAEYRTQSIEPYLQETTVSTIIDREHELLANGVPEHEVHDILKKEFKDISVTELQLTDEDDPYTATGSKVDSQTPTVGVTGHQITNPVVRGNEQNNPNPDDIIFDSLLLDTPDPIKEMKLIRETVAELTHQFNWMTPDYIQRVKGLSPNVGGRFVLVRASAEAITDHRSEGEPHRRLLKGDELAQLTRTGIGKGTDINHLGEEYKVDSDVLDAEYDPIRKETQMLVHLRDPEIIQYIMNGEINTVSINAGMPRHMHTECDTGECFVVPRGLVLGELDGIAFTWVVNNPNGILWRGKYIPRATPGVKVTAIELL